jgi:DNA-binding response OmpR family regulator
MATVLLVDDDPNLLHAFLRILEAEGFRTLTAPNGESALAIACAERPDIIVTDYMMPDVDGIELCRRLKSNGATLDIPVVMLTAAYPLPSSGNGWNALLTKPVGVPELLAVIKSLLTSETPEPTHVAHHARLPNG